MKIVDMKEVENGYWKLTVEIDGDNLCFTENSKEVDLYYRNKEVLIKVINNLNRQTFTVALSDLIVDNMNNKVLKGRYFDKIPTLSELVFAYTINYINSNGALEA